MASAEYHRYLCSREWAVLKRRVRERCNGVCERCKKNDMSDVHHLTYQRIFHERLEDLQGLCRGCHEFISAKSDIDPTKTAAQFLEDMRQYGFTVTANEDKIQVKPGSRISEELRNRIIHYKAEIMVILRQEEKTEAELELRKNAFRDNNGRVRVPGNPPIIKNEVKLLRFRQK